MPRTETMNNVPDERASDIVARFRADGATKVEKAQNADGTWKVTATFAGTPDGGPTADD